jgi:hypothetical protein
MGIVCAVVSINVDRICSCLAFSSNISQDITYLIVIDVAVGRLVVIDLATDTVVSRFGSDPYDSLEFDAPTDVAITCSNNLVVTDRQQISIITIDGVFLYSLEYPTPRNVVDIDENTFGGVFAVTVNKATDEIIIADCHNHHLVVFKAPIKVHVTIVCFCNILLLLL